MSFGKIFRITGGFQTFFKGTGGYLKAGTNFLKSVPEGFSELITDFKGASRYFIFNFLHKKAAKYCENLQRSYIYDCFHF
jgi:hypothetical protein